MPIPSEIEVRFSQYEPPIKCHSLDEVDAALDKLHSEACPECPLAVAIPVFDHEVGIGLGVDPTFLVLHFAPYDGEYYLAVGNGDARGEAVMFYGPYQDSYWRPKNLIPLADARAGVRYFLEHQKGISSVRWEDWAERDANPDASRRTGD
jgi:hypothetical protein